tara:strand:- start:8657 stop:9928 length:1272 start_codon:yes stop_codon:yes gene_type:complete
MKLNKNINIAIIGLGYVGLPLAILFSKKYKVIGFDIDLSRIDELKENNDRTNEISSIELKDAIANNLDLTFEIKNIANCNIYIITVPTPITESKKPDLSFLEIASEQVGKILKKKDIVIYESTVYPGCTEEFCIPVLEKNSSLKVNKDFFIGYSPERINPGDKINTIDKIVKVTSGSNKESSVFIDRLYSSVITAGTYQASSIKIAEASKAIENAQRDLNISFVNELAIIFNLMKIDTNEVLDAASTKWNFLKFKPGLVGGHCISVDPYYLMYKSLELGYKPKVLLSGREVNEKMGKFIADDIIDYLKLRNVFSKDIHILILGVTYKENSRDLRNTRVPDIYNSLNNQFSNIDVYDPHADYDECFNNLNIKIVKDLNQYDLIILAVSHNEFKEINFSKLKKNDKSIIYDIKSFLDKDIVDKRL